MNSLDFLEHERIYSPRRRHNAATSIPCSEKRHHPCHPTGRRLRCHASKVLRQTGFLSAASFATKRRNNHIVLLRHSSLAKARFYFSKPITVFTDMLVPLLWRRDIPPHISVPDPRTQRVHRIFRRSGGASTSDSSGYSKPMASAQSIDLIPADAEAVLVHHLVQHSIPRSWMLRGRHHQRTTSRLSLSTLDMGAVTALRECPTRPQSRRINRLGLPASDHVHRLMLSGRAHRRPSRNSLRIFLSRAVRAFLPRRLTLATAHIFQVRSPTHDLKLSCDEWTNHFLASLSRVRKPGEGQRPEACNEKSRTVPHN